MTPHDTMILYDTWLHIWLYLVLYSFYFIFIGYQKGIISIMSIMIAEPIRVCRHDTFMIPHDTS